MFRIEKLKRPGLAPVNLELPQGTCTTIEGPSGAGKSILLRAIADLDPCDGTVELDGRDRTATAAPEWRRLVCYLPAEPGWWAETAGEHFENGKDVGPLLSRLLIEERALERPIRLLSTGERLRLALARALVAHPKVLLLDEPTGPLDRKATRAVEELLLERKDQGATLLWVTHDPEQAKRVGDTRLSMMEGKLSPLEDQAAREPLQEAGS